MRACVLFLCSCSAGLTPPPFPGAPDAGDAGSLPDGGAQVDSGSPDGGALLPDSGTPTVDAGALDSYLYVGTAGTDIYLFALEPSDAGLTPLGSFPAGQRPSFLAVNGASLYAVNEDSDKVAAFSLGDGGALTFLNRVGSSGAGPAHLSVDHEGKYVLVANYVGGTVAVLPILDGGALGAAVDTQAPGVKAHQIVDVGGGDVFVPCLGSDHVSQFTLTGGHLVPKNPAFAPTTPGAGPRHLALHPNGQWAYVMDETDSTVTVFDVDAGRLTSKQQLTTLPSGFMGNNTGAEIVVGPAGHSVYGSNRGHDSIVHFHVEADGTLTLVQHTSTGGAQPRSFVLVSDGTLLLVANQTTGNIVAMRADPATGALTSLGEVAKVPGPEFVGIVTRRRSP